MVELLECSNWGNSFLFLREEECSICGKEFSFSPAVVFSCMSEPVWEDYLRCIEYLFGSKRHNDIKKVINKLSWGSQPRKNRAHRDLQHMMYNQVPCHPCFKNHKKWFEKRWLEYVSLYKPKYVLLEDDQISHLSHDLIMKVLVDSRKYFNKKRRQEETNSITKVITKTLSDDQLLSIVKEFNQQSLRGSPSGN